MTYSHTGVMDYPRYPISELHPGKFPDSLDVHEVCGGGNHRRGNRNLGYVLLEPGDEVSKHTPNKWPAEKTIVPSSKCGCALSSESTPRE